MIPGWTPNSGNDKSDISSTAADQTIVARVPQVCHIGDEHIGDEKPPMARSGSNDLRPADRINCNTVIAARADLAAGIETAYADLTGMQRNHGHAPIAATRCAKAAEAAGRSQPSFTACGIVRRARAGRLRDSAAAPAGICRRNIAAAVLRQKHQRMRSEKHASSAPGQQVHRLPRSPRDLRHLQ
jgi:hypothetical protein